MIRSTVIFISILSLISCSSFELRRIAPNYFDAYVNIKGSILGFDDYPISRKFVDSIPYASLRLKIGKGSSGLLILEEKQENNLTYLSADNVRVVISNGKIIRTSGLDNNLVNIKEPENAFEDFLKSNKDEYSYYSYLTYDQPLLIDMKTKVTLKKIGKEDVTILDLNYSLLKFQEQIENSYLGWKIVNYYWIDPVDNFIWKSQQTISPLLPLFKYQITKKPAI